MIRPEYIYIRFIFVWKQIRFIRYTNYNKILTQNNRFRIKRAIKSLNWSIIFLLTWSYKHLQVNQGFQELQDYQVNLITLPLKSKNYTLCLYNLYNKNRYLILNDNKFVFKLNRNYHKICNLNSNNYMSSWCFTKTLFSIKTQYSYLFIGWTIFTFFLVFLF